MNYDDKAGALQTSVKIAEREQLEKIQYNSAEARQATVHARQDLVLMVSHISSLNKQAQTIRRLMWAAVILLFIIAGQLSQ